MLRKSLTSLVAILALAETAYGTCSVLWWNQKYWFDSDAVHYTAADLDGDNVPEVISTSATTVSYRKPALFAGVIVYTSTAIGAPVAGDVTGDGKIDLVIPNTANNSLVVLPGNGNGTFGSAVTTALGFTPGRLVLGNFSGSASIDVAILGNSTNVTFLQGDGTGAFTSAGTVAAGGSPVSLAAANFDGDGYADVAVSVSGSSTVPVIFANGSGGAAATVTLDGGTSALLATGDFDADGDADLYSVRPVERRLNVFRNTGSRTFAATTPSLTFSGTTPRSMALADFDGDTDLDLAVGIPGNVILMKRIETTDGSGQYWSEWQSTDRLAPQAVTDNARSIAAADFNNDGRIDLAVENAAAGHGGVVLNECSSVLVGAPMPSLISLGQSAYANISVYPDWGQTVPTGTAKLSWNGGEKTVTLFRSSYAAHASTTVEGLPVGFQPVTVDYSGDANYPPATSTSWVTVTSATTTTTITGPTSWIHGQARTFSASVTSSTGDTPSGSIDFAADNVFSQPTGTAPSAQWTSPSYLGAGAHTIKAEFNSDTHPPSSGSMQVTIEKATSTLQLVSGTMSRAGEAAKAVTWLRTQFSTVPRGTVRLMEGAATLATATQSSPNYWTYPELTVTGLAEGTHTLRFVYDGDATTQGSSIEFQHTVWPANTGVRIVATADTSSVGVETLLLPNASHYLYRRTNGGNWTLMTYLGGDFDVAPGVYQYKVEAVSNNTVVGVSNIETVYVGAFTDASLPGVKIRKAHFTELQSALNGFRAMAGQAPLAIDFTGLIRASHITQMRTAINEARAALGMAAAPFGDTPVARTTRIRASDLHQLRDALR